MGRTVATFHQLIEQARARFARYRRALRREDQRVFDELFARVHYYVASCSYEMPWNPLEAIFLTLLLDQQKQIHQLEERVRDSQSCDTEGESKHGDPGLAPRSLPPPPGDGPVGD